MLLSNYGFFVSSEDFLSSPYENLVAFLSKVTRKLHLESAG
jgi:hypothetical protein